MLKFCPNCGKELSQNWQFPRCPYCGNELPKLPEESMGGNPIMGDANAIAGDMNVNIDSHNTVTNIVHERQKNPEEIQQEKIIQYKQLCEKVYEDGVMTSQEAQQLEHLRITLGLNSAEADLIREQVRQLRLQHSQNKLNPVQKVALQQIVNMTTNGNTDLLKHSFPRLEAMAERYMIDEVQFYYYLILTGLNPEKSIQQYEKRQNDNYWQSFWAYISYLNIGKLDKAQLIITEMEAWSDKPFGNISLLATVECLYSYWEDITQTSALEQARVFLEQGTDGFSDYLDRFAQALMLLAEDNDDTLKQYHTDFSFYFDHILSGLIHKRKMANLYKILPKMPKIDSLTV